VNLRTRCEMIITI